MGRDEKKREGVKEMGGKAKKNTSKNTIIISNYTLTVKY